MAKVTPNNNESIFDFNEMFFSTTDKFGIITSGNNVFQRISQYPVSNLLGAPHNIIRHPDTPKCVFSLLWSTIQNGKPICAYVKNMSANGNYYWVFASVFPTADGYLSVRIKPSSPLFEAAQSLYPLVLLEEKKSGVDASTKLLLKLLADAGFQDYDSFMNQALILEITGRQKFLKENLKLVTTIGTGFNKAVYLRNRDLEQMLLKITAFSNTIKNITQSIEKIKATFDSLRSLTINMSLASSHLGKNANTLAVVSESFQNFANETFQEILKFNDSLNSSRKVFQLNEFQISISYLLNQMLSFFINDQLEEKTENNLLLLREMSALYSKNIDHDLQMAEEHLRELNISAEAMEKTIIALEVVRQSGKVEAAQINGATEAVDPYLQEMLKITKNINIYRRKITEDIGLFLKEIINLREDFKNILNL